jgi:hypothetical protein
MVPKDLTSLPRCGDRVRWGVQRWCTGALQRRACAQRWRIGAR